MYMSTEKYFSQKIFSDFFFWEIAPFIKSFINIQQNISTSNLSSVRFWKLNM